MEKSYKEYLRQIKTFVFDVDGVLTDGSVQVSSQGDLMILAVVGMAARQVSQGSLALDGNEILEIIHFEQRLGGIDHLPDHDGGNIDGIAVAVIDLGGPSRGPGRFLQNLAGLALLLRGMDRSGLEIPHTQRDLLLREERIDPEETRFQHRALVATEEQKHPGLIGGDGHVAEQGDDRDQKQECTEDHSSDNPTLAVIEGDDTHNEEVWTRHRQGNIDHQGKPT